MIASVDRLYARMMSMIAVGRVAASTALGGRGARRLQVRFDAAEIRDETPLLQAYGFASRPHPGADVVVLFPGGNRAAGFIVATNDRRYQVELAAGEAILHDDLGQKIHLTREGIVVDGGGLPITFRNAPLVTVEGELAVTGDVTIAGRSFNGHRHPETGSETLPPT
ncbi:baseplate assembly protein [Roseomonas frigidaquae]|uniref:Baseplate assembly protein n=1 Tax=Falsiroseomonas frigidaquae TaxID=487318 RepID=A0ABX1ESJ4_9PROT|nr:phage baseplate assembly protein [Falsiroseomonas frigidaquae]NKE43586.1 baseplate assembly protein [Falsiroseomonas frigidaquae]